MMITMLVAGLVLLVMGAELLVRGSSRLAAAVGISPLVIGLTVVAYGTSTPELAVSVLAGLDGRPDVALGNVVGSNVFNVLFILGGCAIVLPLAVSRQLIRREVPIMIGVSVLLLLQSLDGRIGKVDSAILLFGILQYTVYTVRSGRKEAGNTIPATPVPGTAVATRAGRWQPVVNVTLVLGGLALLVAGARWFVEGAVDVARVLGLSELVIGLTIIAAGTSLPEVATSIMATIRGEREIAIGNVIGSNIYNILAILGISGLVTPGGLTVAPSTVAFDIPVMIAVAGACLPIFFTGMRVERWEGAVFLGYYAAYVAYLVLDATAHDALTGFRAMMLYFVVPLTVLTLLLVARRHRRAG